MVTGCDPCQSVICINGVCKDGVCDCQAGFEGTDCGDKSRDRFLSGYTVAEQCDNNGAFVYTTTITEAPGSDSTKVLIDNLFDAKLSFGLDPVFAFADSFILTIPSQTLTDLNSKNYTFSGIGVMDPDTTVLVIDYTIVADGNSDNCSATLVKQ